MTQGRGKNLKKIDKVGHKKQGKCYFVSGIFLLRKCLDSDNWAKTFLSNKCSSASQTIEHFNSPFSV